VRLERIPSRGGAARRALLSFVASSYDGGPGRRHDGPVPDPTPRPDRRPDLDWLRVVAVLLVLFFHTGMMFVSWPWVVKSPVRSQALELVMGWLHVWRMPLLLFVSGAGTFLALRHRSPRAFLAERRRRLLVPFAFGCLVIVPPQIYVERIDQYRSFWEFYPTVLELVPYPRGGSLSFHHLWFVLYLLVYSVALLPLLLWLRSPRADPLFDRLARLGERRFGSLAWLLPLVGSQLVLGPWWPHDTLVLVGDYAALVRYGLFFLAGFLFARDPRLWEAVRRERHRNLVVSGLAGAALWAGSLVQVRPTWFGWDALYGIPALVVGWSTLLAIAGWAQVHLTRSGPLLRYATEAVYPFYILHQTVIVILGWAVVRWRGGLWVNYLLICGGSFVATIAIYHLAVRPFALTRLLFGLKPRPRARPAMGALSFDGTAW
jgi:peptidoglycan/LPS O-acetylase OafA/YrhL